MASPDQTPSKRWGKGWMLPDCRCRGGHLHLLYRTEDTVTGDWYVGMHRARRLDCSYLGSGKFIAEHSDRSRLRRTIVSIHQTREANADAEVEYLVKHWDESGRQNILPGGDGMRWADMTSEGREALGAAISAANRREWAQRTPEAQQAKRAEFKRVRDEFYATATPEQLRARSAKALAGCSIHWSDTDNKNGREAKRAEGYTSFWDSLTPEERHAWGKRNGQNQIRHWKEMAPETREAKSKRRSENARNQWAKMTPEARAIHVAAVAAGNARLTPEARDAKGEKIRHARLRYCAKRRAQPSPEPRPESTKQQEQHDNHQHEADAAGRAWPVVARAIAVETAAAEQHDEQNDDEDKVHLVLSPAVPFDACSRFASRCIVFISAAARGPVIVVVAFGAWAPPALPVAPVACPIGRPEPVNCFAIRLPFHTIKVRPG
jgi:hypothetical protein